MKEAIIQGEKEDRTFDAIISSNLSFGWESFDHCLTEVFRSDLITEEVARSYSTHKGIIARAIDDIKKGRGHDIIDTSGLKFAYPEPKPAPVAAVVPPVLPAPVKKKWF